MIKRKQIYFQPFHKSHPFRSFFKMLSPCSARPAAAEEEYDEDDLGGTGDDADGEMTFAEDAEGYEDRKKQHKQDCSSQVRCCQLAWSSISSLFNFSLLFLSCTVAMRPIVHSMLQLERSKIC